MKLFLVTVFIFTALQVPGYAEERDLLPIRPVVKLETVQTLIEFFSLKFRDRNVDFPATGIDVKYFQELHALSGLHRVSWEGGDSLYSFQCYVRDGAKLYRYGFKFTISPKRGLGTKSPGKVNEIFDDRILTQFYIWRIEDTFEPREEVQVEDILIETNTDDMAEQVDNAN